MIVRAVVLALALVAARTTQDERKLTEAPDRRIELDLQHYYPAKKLQITLSALATAYPELVRVESLGKSRGGEELSLVTLGQLEGGDANERPALLVVGSVGADDVFGAELALGTLWQILQDNQRDGAVRDVLERCTLYFVPALDPDLRERAFAELEGDRAGTAPREAVLDRNFPARWSPLRTRDGGPYPLSEPESRALAEFLVGRPNVAMVQGYTTRAVDAAATMDDVPRADRELHRALAGENMLSGLEQLRGRDGSFATFAYLQHGAFVFTQPFAFQSEDAWRLPPVLEIQHHARAAATVTLRLARSLARLELTLAVPESLGSDQWTLDVEVANTGRLPTAGAVARERSACAAPRIEVEGAKLVAAAIVDAGGAEPVACRAARVELDEIAGESTRRVRLFLAAPSESTVTISARAPRAGRASGTTTLR